MPMRIKFRIRPNYSAVGIMDCKVIGFFASQPVLYSPMGQHVVKIQRSKTNICVGRYCNAIQETHARAVTRRRRDFFIL